MTCTHCGSPTDAGAIACPDCGTLLDEGLPPAPSGQGPPPPEDTLPLQSPADPEGIARRIDHLADLERREAESHAAIDRCETAIDQLRHQAIIEGIVDGRNAEQREAQLASIIAGDPTARRAQHTLATERLTLKLLQLEIRRHKRRLETEQTILARQQT